MIKLEGTINIAGRNIAFIDSQIFVHLESGLLPEVHTNSILAFIAAYKR